MNLVSGWKCSLIRSIVSANYGFGHPIPSIPLSPVTHIRQWTGSLHDIGITEALRISDRIGMDFDGNGYDTTWSDMELYLPTLSKEAYRNSFMYMSGKLWTDIPTLYKILQLLNHSNVIMNCTNCSLTPGWLQFWRFFAICQFLI